MLNYQALNDEILSHRLSEVIGRYCHLQNEGLGRKKCKCPFHHEKTPSFHLDDNKGLWHCFGCGEGGNIFTFVQKIKSCDFKQAVDELCDIFSIEKSKYIITENKENIKKKADFFDTMNAISEYYEYCLTKDNEALNYLQNIRGLKKDILSEFSFGLADNNLDALIDFCKKNNISENQLIECGIFKKKQHSNNRNDNYLFFRNRIIIPIKNEQGKIVAFGGRIYKSEDLGPKYLNSSENIFFKKGNLLFNFYNAKRNLNKNNKFIIVEGYMDAISLYQHGFKTSIAPLGTSITEEHLKKIFDYCKEPIFLFDSDEAGKKASIRACNIIFPLLKVGIIPKFCNLHGAKDVDEFLLKYTEKQLKKQLEDAVEINDFIFNSYINKYDFTNQNQVALFEQDIKTLFNKIKEPDLKKRYNIFLKKKLFEMDKIYFSSFSSTGKNTTLKSDKKLLSDNNYKKYNKPVINKMSNDFLEKKIIALLLRNDDLLDDYEIYALVKKISQKNQSLFFSLKEDNDFNKKDIFCNYYCSDKEKQDKNNIITLFIQLELKQLETSNLPPDVKASERKKIIDKKKKILNSS